MVLEIENSKKLAVIVQRLEDMSNQLKRIESHAEYTNGKIADTIKTLNTVELSQIEIKTKQAECPARNNYLVDKQTNREWIKWVPTVLSLLVAVYAVFLT